MNPKEIVYRVNSTNVYSKNFLEKWNIKIFNGVAITNEQYKVLLNLEKL